jgi:hypothetical protein
VWVVQKVRERVAFGERSAGWWVLALLVVSGGTGWWLVSMLGVAAGGVQAEQL